MEKKNILLVSSPSKSYKINRIAIEIIVAILIIIWLHTGISKLIEYKSFRIQMSQSPIFYNISEIATLGGPIMEILLAILLILKRTRLAGLLGSFILMSFFVWYVSWLMINLPKLPCSCGGIVGFLTWPQHLTLNIFLAAISALGFLLVKKNKRSISNR